MSTGRVILCILIMAAVSYLPRVIPLALFKRPIKNVYVRSFLTYLPFSILAAMIVPEIFFSGGHILAAVFGAGVGALLAFRRCGLLTVAVAACTAVYIAEQVILLCA